MNPERTLSREVYLGLGSNIGDRYRHLRDAIRALEAESATAGDIAAPASVTRTSKASGSRDSRIGWPSSIASASSSSRMRSNSSCSRG